MLHCVWLCQELQRALEIERSERQSTEARTLQLLSEVREYHNKIANLKDAKSRCVCVCACVCACVCVCARHWSGLVAATVCVLAYVLACGGSDVLVVVMWSCG